MDTILTDPERLEAIAEIINAYISRQNKIILDYSSNVQNLSSEWRDDKTLAPLLTEVRQLRQEVFNIGGEIRQFVDYLNKKATDLKNRPEYRNSYNNPITTTSVSSTQNNSMRIAIMGSKPLDRGSLNKEFCAIDQVGNIDSYVKVSSNGRRIAELEDVGTFRSPTNGERIYCKAIAWRSTGVTEANSSNVCGADFYYANGQYCGTYIGKNLQEIYSNNVADTKFFRK